ncbi:MAG: hypothetical protein ABIG69_14800 [Bacteroidota bacterium]
MNIKRLHFQQIMLSNEKDCKQYERQIFLSLWQILSIILLFIEIINPNFSNNLYQTLIIFLTIVFSVYLAFIYLPELYWAVIGICFGMGYPSYMSEEIYPQGRIFWIIFHSIIIIYFISSILYRLKFFWGRKVYSPDASTKQNHDIDFLPWAHKIYRKINISGSLLTLLWLFGLHILFMNIPGTITILLFVSWLYYSNYIFFYTEDSISFFDIPAYNFKHIIRVTIFIILFLFINYLDWV